MKRVKRGWNGGSREAAMDAAKKRREVAVLQGASWCEVCHGEAIIEDHQLCPKCRGAGVIVPEGGLQLPVLHS